MSLIINCFVFCSSNEIWGASCFLHDALFQWLETGISELSCHFCISSGECSRYEWMVSPDWSTVWHSVMYVGLLAIAAELCLPGSLRRVDLALR